MGSVFRCFRCGWKFSQKCTHRAIASVFLIHDIITAYLSCHGAFPPSFESPLECPPRPAGAAPSPLATRCRCTPRSKRQPAAMPKSSDDISNTLRNTTKTASGEHGQACQHAPLKNNQPFLRLVRPEAASQHLAGSFSTGNLATSASSRPAASTEGVKASPRRASRASPGPS